MMLLITCIHRVDFVVVLQTVLSTVLRDVAELWNLSNLAIRTISDATSRPNLSNWARMRHHEYTQGYNPEYIPVSDQDIPDLERERNSRQSGREVKQSELVIRRDWNILQADEEELVGVMLVSTVENLCMGPKTRKRCLRQQLNYPSNSQSQSPRDSNVNYCCGKGWILWNVRNRDRVPERLRLSQFLHHDHNSSCRPVLHRPIVHDTQWGVDVLLLRGP